MCQAPGPHVKPRPTGLPVAAAGGLGSQAVPGWRFGSCHSPPGSTALPIPHRSTVCPEKQFGAQRKVFFLSAAFPYSLTLGTCPWAGPGSDDSLKCAAQRCLGTWAATAQHQLRSLVLGQVPVPSTSLRSQPPGPPGRPGSPQDFSPAALLLIPRQPGGQRSLAQASEFLAMETWLPWAPVRGRPKGAGLVKAPFWLPPPGLGRCRPDDQQLCPIKIPARVLAPGLWM